MSKKAPRSPARTNPHVTTKERELRLEGKPLIYLLVDPTGARLIAAGEVPPYVQQQAEDALEWFAEEVLQ